jgi:hypothetical protein
VTEVTDTTAARKRLGMPERFGSCHTATVDGYVLEGHVPATEVERLLASGTKAIGLAVPGMPPGSPGMETGARRDQYQVLLIDQSRRASVYAAYPKWAQQVDSRSAGYRGRGIGGSVIKAGEQAAQAYVLEVRRLFCPS